MPTARKAIRALKADFDVAHQQGMAALQRRDFPALDAAIQQESEILAEQKNVIAEHVHRVRHLLPALHDPPARKRRRKAR